MVKSVSTGITERRADRPVSHRVDQLERAFPRGCRIASVGRGAATSGSRNAVSGKAISGG